jgi:triacylglycerol lipase
MGATLSPFRYAQVAKYALQRWLDQTPNVVKSTWKGKGRATPVVTATPSGSRQASGSSSSSSSSESDVSPGADSGPSSSTSPESPDLSGSSSGSSKKSRYILQPDSRMPPQPTEIYRLMNDERLLEPGRLHAPKEIIVLCHGESSFTRANLADDIQGCMVSRQLRQYLSFPR